MDKLYAKEPNFSENGPSDLTIKRILAFSKALKNYSATVTEKEEEQS